MFIRLASGKTNKDKIVYLVEGYRDSTGKSKQRIIIKFGRLSELQKDNPNILEELKFQYNNKDNDDDSIVYLPIDLSKSNNISNPILNYGYFFLDAIYESLKLPSFISNCSRNKDFKYDLNKILKLLVFGRILNPASKKETFETKEKYFNMNFDFSLDDVYRSLSHMESMKERIQSWIHNQVKESIGRDVSLVFYDVTNYYFETEIQDDDEYDEDNNLIDKGLRKKGVSKEHRPEPIVQMGMFIDNKGIPIAYKLFPGNTNDKATLLPILEEMKELYELGRIIVVADKGLNSGSNLLFIKSKGDGYVVAQQIRKRKQEMIDKVLNEDGYIYNESNTFKIKDWIEEKKVSDNDGHTHLLKEKVVCFWSKDFEDREKYKRGNLEDLIKKFQAKPSLYTASNSFGVKKYLKERNLDKETGEVKKKNPVLIFDEEKYKRDTQLDGYYMLVSSELNLSNAEIIEKYRGLWKIEESFRIIKSDLEGRPVYVHTKEHIEGHFLTCFISLVIMRILQNKLECKYTAANIQKALNEATVQLLDKEIYSVAKQNDVFKEIETIYNADLDKAHAKLMTIKQYNKKIHNTLNQ
jgi:transposase